MSLDWIDTHIHLSAPEYAEDLQQVLDRAADAGIYKFLAIGSGYEAEGLAKTLEISANHPQVYAAVGIHPNEAHKGYNPQLLCQHLQYGKVLAIGETGLDYFRNHCPPQQQKDSFIAQIKIALQFQKPLIIHSRAAAEDCLKILQDHNAQAVGGVFHCFAEDALFAVELAKINFMISLTGNLTYKNNQAYRDIISAVPIEQIMLETDGPYLAPQSKRGRRNESAFLVETAQTLADIKGITLAEVARITTQNALRLFKF